MCVGRRKKWAGGPEERAALVEEELVESVVGQ